MRPSSERDGECICDYNPTTTDGPQEDCPFHGRPYAYWIERGDALIERLLQVRRYADAQAVTAKACGREDRDWLDLLAILDRPANPNPPAPEASAGVGEGVDRG